MSQMWQCEGNCSLGDICQAMNLVFAPALPSFGFHGLLEVVSCLLVGGAPVFVVNWDCPMDQIHRSDGRHCSEPCGLQHIFSLNVCRIEIWGKKPFSGSIFFFVHTVLRLPVPGGCQRAHVLGSRWHWSDVPSPVLSDLISHSSCSPKLVNGGLKQEEENNLERALVCAGRSCSVAQPRAVCIPAAAAHLPPGRARFLLLNQAPGTEPCLSVAEDCWKPQLF